MRSDSGPPNRVGPRNSRDTSGDTADGPHGQTADRTESSANALVFRVELWDLPKTKIEQVLAEAATAAIGYAAYNGAIRAHPDRYVTIRQRARILSSWNAPSRA